MTDIEVLRDQLKIAEHEMKVQRARAEDADARGVGFDREMLVQRARAEKAERLLMLAEQEAKTQRTLAEEAHVRAVGLLEEIVVQRRRIAEAEAEMRALRVQQGIAHSILSAFYDNGPPWPEAWLTGFRMRVGDFLGRGVGGSPRLDIAAPTAAESRAFARVEAAEAEARDLRGRLAGIGEIDARMRDRANRCTAAEERVRELEKQGAWDQERAALVVARAARAEEDLRQSNDVRRDLADRVARAEVAVHNARVYGKLLAEFYDSPHYATPKWIYESFRPRVGAVLGRGTPAVPWADGIPDMRPTAQVLAEDVPGAVIHAESMETFSRPLCGLPLGPKDAVRADESVATCVRCKLVLGAREYNAKEAAGERERNRELNRKYDVLRGLVLEFVEVEACMKELPAHRLLVSLPKWLSGFVPRARKAVGIPQVAAERVQDGVAEPVK